MKSFFLRVACVACVATAVIACQRQTTSSKPMMKIPRTVGELLVFHEVELRQTSFIDEPPGKLREINFVYDDVVVKARLEYTAKLFNEKRTWDIGQVSDAKIVQLTYSWR